MKSGSCTHSEDPTLDQPELGLVQYPPDNNLLTLAAKRDNQRVWVLPCLGSTQCGGAECKWWMTQCQSVGTERNSIRPLHPSRSPGWCSSRERLWNSRTLRPTQPLHNRRRSSPGLPFVAHWQSRELTKCKCYLFYSTRSVVFKFGSMSSKLCYSTSEPSHGWRVRALGFPLSASTVFMISLSYSYIWVFVWGKGKISTATDKTVLATNIGVHL